MVAYITVCEVCGERAPYHSDACALASQAPLLVPESAAFAGLAGDVVSALEPHTEADPAAVLLTVLANFGAMVRGGAETQASSAKHPPAIYAAFIGRTSRSRKGTSEREVSGLMAHVEDGWERRHRVAGSVRARRSSSTRPRTPAMRSMVESEFARVLAVASREGSSASSVLRGAGISLGSSTGSASRPTRPRRLRCPWSRISPPTSSETAVTGSGSTT